MGSFRFINPHVKELRKSFWHFLLWRLGYYEDPTHKLSPPKEFFYPAKAKVFSSKEPYAQWIGHSSYLLHVGAINILTDPVFGDYCSPVAISALKRKKEPAIALHELPVIDLVLISHNHYDHLDEGSVLWLHQKYPSIQWVVPERLSPWFKKRGIENVVELGWWESRSVGSACVHAVPTQHFSGRGLFDTNKTHWNGYVVEVGGKRIYFAGDSGYNNKDFKEIGKRFAFMDLSLIPIGTYAPQKFMQPVHMCPQEAVMVHEDVKSRLSLGMHWKTFCLSEEPEERPPFDLYLAMKAKGLAFERFLPVDIGVKVNF